MSEPPEKSEKPVVFQNPSSILSHRQISNNLPRQQHVNVPILSAPRSIPQLSSGDSRFPPFMDVNDLGNGAFNSPLTPVSLLPYDLSRQMAVDNSGGAKTPQIYTSYLNSPLTPGALTNLSMANLNALNVNGGISGSSSTSPNFNRPQNPPQVVQQGPLSPATVEELGRRQNEQIVISGGQHLVNGYTPLKTRAAFIPRAQKAVKKRNLPIEHMEESVVRLKGSGRKGRRKKSKKRKGRRKKKKKKKDRVKFLVKPARKPASCYLPNLPDKAYSHPYKYDLSINIPVSYGEKSVGLRLRATKSGEHVDYNHKKKKSIKHEKKTEKESDCGNYMEHSFRVVFQVCSFHYQRSTFVLEIYVLEKGTNVSDSDAMDGEQPVFVTDPFEMFARKNKKSDKEWPSEDEVRGVYRKMEKDLQSREKAQMKSPERRVRPKRQAAMSSPSTVSTTGSTPTPSSSYSESPSPVDRIPLTKRSKYQMQLEQQQLEQQQQEFSVPRYPSYPGYSQVRGEVYPRYYSHAAQGNPRYGSTAQYGYHNFSQTRLPEHVEREVSTGRRGYPLRKRHRDQRPFYAESPLTPKTPASPTSPASPATPKPRDEMPVMPMRVEEEDEETDEKLTGSKRKRPVLPKLKTDLKRIKRGHVVDKSVMKKHHTV